MDRWTSLLCLCLALSAQAYTNQIVSETVALSFADAAGPIITVPLGTITELSFPITDWSLSGWVNVVSIQPTISYIFQVHEDSNSVGVFWAVDGLFNEIFDDTMSPDHPMPASKWVYIGINVNGKESKSAYIEKGDTSIYQRGWSRSATIASTQSIKLMNGATAFTVSSHTGTSCRCALHSEHGV